MFKARIKILVKELDAGAFRARRRGGVGSTSQRRLRTVPDERDRAARGVLRAAAVRRRCPRRSRLRAARSPTTAHSRNWVEAQRARRTRCPGYAIVTLSLKKTGVPPGDATSDQMDAVADLADRYSFGELRVSHEQNLIFADVRQADLLRAVAASSRRSGSRRRTSACSPTSSAAPAATSARSPTRSRSRSPKRSSSRFDDLDYLHDIGELDLNISGCMNACGHHHVGHIGILGVDKNGDEWYQVSIGGAQGDDAALGKVIGPRSPRTTCRTSSSA